MREDISALADGELGEDEALRLLASLRNDPDLRSDWDSCHLIGDALRGHLSRPVASSVARRLAAEPTVLAPRARAVEPERHYTRWVMSAAASLAAVAFVGWVAVTTFQGDTEPQFAQAPQVPESAGVQGYLLAHQRYSPSSAMQGVAPYVRLVTDDTERSGR